MDLELISRLPTGEKRQTPLLFVHGLWHGAWCWEPHFLDYFAAKGYASYALSLRGHGKSPPRRLLGLRIRDFVEDVLSAAAQLPAPPVLVAHSMGGLVVQKLLENYRAPAAILLSSVPPHGTILAVLRAITRHPLPFLMCNLKLSMYPLVGTPALAHDMLFAADTPAALVRQYFPLIEDDSYTVFWDMLAFDLPRPPRVKTPLLVLGGESDRIFSPAEVQGTARAYHADTRIFPGLAHDLMLEPGWEAVAAEMFAWLERQGIS
jgi:pimeloyl-ACP methyl ester carboxylesterase